MNRERVKDWCSERNITLKAFAEKRLAFFVGFVIMLLYLLPKESMANSSGDAADIWQTIKTYGTDSVYGSYVLYKGFNAVYPYVWLYRLAMLFGLDEWFFVKVFYCSAFAYVSAIGFPNVVERLTGQKTRNYRRVLLVLLCFYFWEYTMALSQLMVDLPCMMYFVLLVNAALKIYERKQIQFRNLGWTGFLIGLNLCASGQYTMPAICVVIFLVIVLIDRYKGELKANIGRLTGYMCAAFIPAFAIKRYNVYFLDVFVAGLVEKGAWIPSSGTWLSIGLTRFMTNYRVGCGITIPSNRNPAIFQDFLGVSQFEEMYDTILAGGYPLTILEYMKLFFKYPLDFALCYLEKFFLALSPDREAFHFVPLFIFYTLLFIALYIGITKCGKIKNIFNAKFWIGFGFLWAIVPGLVMLIEPRWGMQIQGLILALAVGNDCIWNKLSGFCKWKENLLVKEEKVMLGERKISKAFVIYCFFIVMCFMHMASLYEKIGVDAANILVQF